MLTSSQTRAGFTIVELLIVIVVIAILATISVVAYNGISGRANDTTVQSDIRNFAGKIMEQQALNGAYPAGVGDYIGSPAATTGGVTTFRLARGSYATNVNNFYYCATNDTFAIGAVSKTGKKFYYTPGTGLAEYTGSWGFSSTNCPGMGMPTGWTFTNAYSTAVDTWAPWSQ